MDKPQKSEKAKHSEEKDVLDRQVFVLSEEQWEAFNEALNRSPQENPKLKKLLTEPGLFD